MNKKMKLVSEMQEKSFSKRNALLISNEKNASKLNFKKFNTTNLTKSLHVPHNSNFYQLNQAQEELNHYNFMTPPPDLQRNITKKLYFQHSKWNRATNFKIKNLSRSSSSSYSRSSSSCSFIFNQNIKNIKKNHLLQSTQNSNLNFYTIKTKKKFRPSNRSEFMLVGNRNNNPKSNDLTSFTDVFVLSQPKLKLNTLNLSNLKTVHNHNIIDEQVKPKSTLIPNRQKLDSIQPNQYYFKHHSHKKQLDWNKKYKFLLICINSAIHLNNIWRFPYLCYKYGGGAFLITYIICSILIGFPLMLIEFTIGQYSNMNTIHIFKNLVPIFKGIGFIIISSNIIIVIYYNVINSWSLIYIFETFNNMQWKTCHLEYSDKNCVSLESIRSLNNSNLIISSEDFFDNYVLGKSNELDQNVINFKMVFALIVSWIVVLFGLYKGVQSIGKINYYISILLYLILVVFFMKAIILNGATDGIIYYIIPDLTKLNNSELWEQATIQVFYTLGIATGKTINYATLNKFHNPIIKSVLLIWFVNILTALFSGFLIFSIIGHITYSLEQPINNLVNSSPGLIFIVISELLLKLQWPYFLSFSFFFMLFIIGINSQLSSLEIIGLYFLDFFKKKSFQNELLFLFITCLILFVPGLAFCTSSGIYLIEIVDCVSNEFAYLFIAFLESFIISYIFRIESFFNILKTMNNWHPKLLLKSYLTILISTICPLFLMFLIYNNILQLINEPPIQIKSFKFQNLLSYFSWTFIILNLTIFICSTLHYIFIQKIEKNFFHKSNKKMSFWIKIRTGIKETYHFRQISFFNHEICLRIKKNVDCFYQKNQLTKSCAHHFYFNDKTKNFRKIKHLNRTILNENNSNNIKWQICLNEDQIKKFNDQKF